MKYYSTNKKSPSIDFRTATIEGLAPDKGLYFPESVPQIDADLLKSIKSLSNDEIGYRVMKPYVEESLPDTELKRIIEETLNYTFPLVKVNDQISSLELFHGPTFAFKDLGARFMSRCLGYFARNISKRMIVLVATSGDTGGAVANGFYDVPGVDVVILYPSGKVSDVQERQLTTLGKNISALEVKGTFDDCQRMVKEAFADTKLRDKLFLTSANSINVARWLPQQLFYFFAHKQWECDSAPIAAVPSGNFGNICSGMLANKSGLPIKKFIVACNVNDSVPEFLTKGVFEPKATISTISNAMDVGNPSNFARMLELYGHSHAQMAEAMRGYSVTDDATRATIKEAFDKYNYWLDPHGAVAFNALQQYVGSNPDAKGYILETAHPVKFNSGTSIKGTLSPELAKKVADLNNGTKKSTVIAPEYADLKKFLLAD